MSKEVKDTQKQDVKNKSVDEKEFVDGDASKKEEAEVDEKVDEKSQQLEELGKKLAEINDKYLRLSAEFDNYRKRTLKEKMELTKNAGEQILEKILPVMDNFERALQSMETATDVPALREGILLIFGAFKDFLLQQGVKEMECINTDFDSETQEAVTKIPAPTEDMKGKVVDCIQKGYTLHDKVMRFPKVVVGE